MTGLTSKGSAIPIRGDVFLTAARLFDGVLQGKSGRILEFKATSQSIKGLGAIATNVTDLEPYNAQDAFDGIQSGNPVPDLAIFQTGMSMNASNLSPIVAFTDQNAAAFFLMGQTLTTYGAKTSGALGTYSGMTGTGLFSFNVARQDGDICHNIPKRPCGYYFVAK